MKIIEVQTRKPALVAQLLALWEGSVKATHTFLTEDEVHQIKQYVPQALQNVPVLVVALDASDRLLGFMGIAEHTLEMLFVAKDKRGQGIGRQLLEYGLTKYALTKLTVNEQNPQARNFYERMGFSVYQRTPLDEQGNPYPLLYMKRD